MAFLWFICLTLFNKIRNRVVVYYFQIGNSGVDIGIELGRDVNSEQRRKPKKDQNERCAEGAGGVSELEAEPKCVDAFGEYVYRNGLAEIWVSGIVFCGAPRGEMIGKSSSRWRR
ncbi:MAG: hypothetical protein ACRDDA_05190 [Aeromonas sp.]